MRFAGRAGLAVVLLAGCPGVTPNKQVIQTTPAPNHSPGAPPGPDTSLVVSTGGTRNSWRPFGAMGISRIGQSAFVDGDTLYVLDGEPTGTGEGLSLESGAWKFGGYAETTLSRTLAAAALVSPGRFAHVGGTGAGTIGGDVRMPDMGVVQGLEGDIKLGYLLYDAEPANDARARAALGLAMVGTTLVAAGGYHGDAVEDAVDRWLDPDRRTGDAVAEDAAGICDSTPCLVSNPGAPMPLPVAGHGFVSIGDRAYALGGFDLVAGLPVARGAVQIYDPVADRWTRGPAMPTPRYGCGAAVLDGLIYVVGGYGTDGKPSRAVEAYDPRTDSWQAKALLPSRRAYVSLASHGGHLYAVGGVQADGTATREVLEYTP